MASLSEKAGTGIFALLFGLIHRKTMRNCSDSMKNSLPQCAYQTNECKQTCLNEEYIISLLCLDGIKRHRKLSYSHDLGLLFIFFPSSSAISLRQVQKLEMCLFD